MSIRFMSRYATLLPLAVSALAAAGAAQAQSQVTVYGIMAVEVIHADNVNTGSLIGSQSLVENSRVAASRLGFRGSEDVGGGLRAVFDIQSGISPDTGSANATKFWNRGAWVGLSSASLGTLTFGRHWNLNDDIMSRYYIFGGYGVFRYREFGFISDLVDNSVKYVSPVFGGLQARALVAAGEGSTGRTVEAAVNYRAGPLELAASHRNAKNLNGAADKLSTVGASFTAGPVRLHGAYSEADLRGSGLRKATAYDLGAVWAATPTFSVMLDYIARNQKGTGNDSNFVRLQGDYALSKRTYLFGNLLALNNKGTASERLIGNGAAGKDQKVYAAGIRHLF